MKQADKGKSRPRNIISRHKLGARGHFTLPKRLLETAADFGFEITQRGHGTYRYEISSAHDDLELLCPPYLEKHRNDKGYFSRAGMIEFLHFARQPIASTLGYLVDDDFVSDDDLRAEWRQSKDAVFTPYMAGPPLPGKYERDLMVARSDRAQKIFAERKATHQALRFLTTGNTIIPKKEGYEHLDEEYNECHEVSENATRQEHNWAHLPEIGLSDSIQVTVPGAGYVPGEGFVLSIHPEFKAANLFGQNRRALRDFTLQALSQITGRSLTLDALDDRITLDGAQMQAFVQSVHRFYQSTPGQNVFSEARIEDLALRRLKNMITKKQVMQGSEIRQFLQGDQADAHLQIDNLLLSSSMLSDVLDSRMMRNMQRASRPFTPSPLDGTLEEMKIFRKVLTALGEQDQVTSLDLEVFVHEFYKERAFMQKFVSAAQEALEKESKGRFLSNDMRDALAQMQSDFEKLQNALHRAGITRLGLSDQFLDKNHEEIISSLQNYIGRKETLIAHFNRQARETYKGGIAPILDFFVDSLKSTVAAPIPLALFISMVVASYYYANKDRPKVVSAPQGMAAVENIAIPDDIGVDFSEMDFSEMDFSDIEDPLENTSPLEDQIAYVEQEDIPDAPEGWDEKGHWDIKLTLKGVELYKHLVGGKIVQLSNGLLNGKITLSFDQQPFDLVNVDHDLGVRPHPDSKFAQSAESMIQPSAETFLWVNGAQNISHAGYWTYTLMVGAMFGLGALRHLGMFFGPMANLGYSIGAFGPRASRKLLDILTGNPRQAKRLIKLFETIETKGFHNLSDEDHFENMKLLSDIMAQHDMDLKIGGMYHDVSLTPQSRNDLARALVKNDVLVNHIGGNAGIEGEFFTQVLNDHREKVFEALRNGDQAALQHNIEPLIAAEIRHTGGNSEIFNALTAGDDVLHRKQVARLNRQSRHMSGALGRKEWRVNKIAELKSLASNQNERPGIFQLSGALAGLGLSRGLDAVMSGSKNVQNGVSYVPRSVKIMAAGGVMLPVATSLVVDQITAGQAANLVGSNMAPAVDALSSAAGVTSGAAVPFGAGLGYNYFEDILLVHVGGAAGFVLVGYVGGKVVYGQVARPTTLLAAEYLKAASGIDGLEGVSLASDWTGRQCEWLKEDIWSNGISRPLATSIQKFLFSAEEEQQKPVQLPEELCSHGVTPVGQPPYGVVEPSLSAQQESLDARL